MSDNTALRNGFARFALRRDLGLWTRLGWDPATVTAAEINEIIGDNVIPLRGASNGPDAASCLDAALRYAGEFDWLVFPADLEDGRKKPHKSAPHSGGASWGMTKDAARIRKDFRRWPLAGVGVPTGRINKLIDIEADTPKGHAKLQGIDGRASLATLEKELGPLPDTAMFESPSGSPHRLFNYPMHLADIWINPVPGRLAPGVDVCADGDMMIAPPSVRSDGAYRWLNDLPLADLPQAWIKRLIEISSGSGARTKANGETTSAFGKFSEQRKRAPLEKLERALTIIPIDGMKIDGQLVSGREFYVKVGHAVKAATNGGLEVCICLRGGSTSARLRRRYCYQEVAGLSPDCNWGRYFVLFRRSD